MVSKLLHDQPNQRKISQPNHSISKTKAVNQKIFKIYREIGSSPSLASGIIEYNLGKNFLISTFAENQAVQFPPSSVAAFPVIQKVLYGVPGFDIDMTEWFRSYFFQNQVNGRLNKQINFNSIFGDPKFENFSFLTFSKVRSCKVVQNHLLYS
jgi:hypothetical protein